MHTRAQYLRRMLRNETLTESALRATQHAAIDSLVRHAGAQVPFYNDLYREHGVDLQRFRAERDLQRLPIIDKNDLRRAGSLTQWSGARDAAVTISTLGSMGEPFAFRIDRDYDQWRKAQYLRPYIRSGRTLRDKVLRLTAFPSARRPLMSWLGLLREWQFNCATPAAELYAK